MQIADDESSQSWLSVRRNALALRDLVATLVMMVAIIFVGSEAMKGRERDQYRRTELAARRYLTEFEAELSAAQTVASQGIPFKRDRPFITSRLAVTDRPDSVLSWEAEIGWLRKFVDELKTDVLRSVQRREELQRSMILPF